jgi:16S rRNA (cytosine967-C5)-methyltransferase
VNTRAIAADILLEVVRNGRSLTAALEQGLTDDLSPKDRTFIQALCYGVVRWYWRLQALLQAMTHKPIKDERIRMLALIGFYQIGFMRVAAHAAVSETVDAVEPDIWAKPLINALIRNYQRNRETLEQRIDSAPHVAFAHPQWLFDKIKRDWPAHVLEIFAANNDHPPMTLRVNQSRISTEAYLATLHDAGIAAKACDAVKSAVVLDEPIPIEGVPGFASGDVSVQDAAAQLAAFLLEPEPGQRVLDLCAAPGGKTCHILESNPNLNVVVAVDVDASRLERVSNSLERIGISAELIAGDASQPDAWWNGEAFDRILVDAPCSATGVIRRHPDIKVLRKPQDIARLAEIQKTILESAWSMLKEEGILLYATCSILRQENSDVIGHFLRSHSDAIEELIPEHFGLAEPHGRQILPGMMGMDGFYYAKLKKTSN